MAGKIPATVVTGFLGAGKTTLIRHLLETADGARIALVINEFGDLGVDGAVLEGCGAAACGAEGAPGGGGPDIVELSNGCICCAVAEDFAPALRALIDRPDPPDHIVIETSGLALPQPLLAAFGWPEIRTRVGVDGVVAVVDGAALAEGRFAWDEAAVEAQRAAIETLDHDAALAELFEDQLACADLVVLNKTDLLAAGASDRLEAELAARARPGAAIVRAAQSRVSPAAALGLGLDPDAVAARVDSARHHGRRHHAHPSGDGGDPHGQGRRHHPHDDHHRHDHDHHHHHHHHHDGRGDAADHGHDAFASIVVGLGELADARAFAAALPAVLKRFGLLRLKGFAAVRGKPMRLTVQAVGPRVESHFDGPFPAGAPRETRLVAIGRAGFDAAALERALAAAAEAGAPAPLEPV